MVAIGSGAGDYPPRRFNGVICLIIQNDYFDDLITRIIVLLECATSH